ncbi:MAG: hypothetical protein IKH81_06200 [Clostridia bacterium]|nr:hypothetical protein [Clostridia bacterium]
MKTDVIKVSSRGSRIETALNQAQLVADYKKLSPKNALHLRLLAEETLCMMRSITGETEGEFWIEDEDGVYQLHLRVRTPMDSVKREQLLAVSSSGKNESARGLMGRLRNFFDMEADEDIAAVSGTLYAGLYEETSSTSVLDYEWSMLRYEEQLAARIRTDDTAAKEAWDEIEKSVVAHVADDVKVSIRGRTVEMTIFKKMA